MLGALVSTKTKCMKLIFIGKITLVPVAFLMALGIDTFLGNFYYAGYGYVRVMFGSNYNIFIFFLAT